MPPANFHHQPKFTLADCQKMQADLAAGRVTPRQLKDRTGVSLTIIYRIRDGKYGVQLQAAREALAAVEAEKNRDPSLCPGCGLSTGLPCLICAAQDTADKSIEKPKP